MARTDEGKWKRIVASVKASDKGGKPGQWSARKAQLASQKYKKSGDKMSSSSITMTACLSFKKTI